MVAPRAPKKVITLPPVRDVEDVELELHRAATRARCTFSEIRRRAYRLFLFGDPFTDPDGSSVHDRSVFPDTGFGEQLRASQGDTL